MNRETWVAKIGNADKSDEANIIEKLETLNESDWRQLLYRFATVGDDDLDLLRIFADVKGYDVFSGLASTVRKLGKPAITIFGAAVDMLCLQFNRAHDPEISKGLRELLLLVGAVKRGPRAETLIRLGQDKSIEQELRILATSVLANQDNQPEWYFWPSLDLKSNPFFSSCYLIAAANQNPEEGLMLFDAPFIDDNLWATLEAPARRCLAAFLKTPHAIERLAAVAFDFSELGQRRLQYILDLDEFRQQRIAEKAFSQEKVSSLFNELNWERFCRRCRKENKIPTIDFGYDRGNLLGGGYTESPYYAELIDAIRVEISVTLNDHSVRLPADPVKTETIDNALEKILKFEAICVEPLHGTSNRLNKIDLIRIGKIEVIAAYGIRTVMQRLASHLGGVRTEHRITIPCKTLPEDITNSIQVSLGDFVSFAIKQNCRILTLDGTAVHEEIVAICERERQSDPRESALPVKKRVFPLEPDPKYIFMNLRYWKNAVFVTDWRTVYDLWRKKRKLKMMAFPLKYDRALSVGYCIPRGDESARNHMARALGQAFLDSGRNWKVEFASEVENTGVRLDRPPEHLLAAIDSEIQIGQNRMSV